MNKATIGCAETGKQEAAIFVCKHILHEDAPLADYQEPGEVFESEPDFEQPGFAFCEVCLDDEDRLSKGSIVCFPCFEHILAPKLTNA